MTFGLAPGKLGFKLGEVLVGLQSGTQDTPETIASTQNKLTTVGYLWNPDTLAYEVPVQALTDTELRATPVPVSNSVLTTALNSTTSRLKVEQPSMSMTASGFSRVAALTTLFDGKILGAENTRKWSTKGTGTATFSENAITMTVTSGQYLVRQAQYWCPYYSGKPQLIETTYINFQYEAGVVKRAGYFSSSATAPYTANFDGFYIESDGVNSTYRLVFVRNGTETHNIPWTSWDNYAAVASYDWSKFSVNEVDFLWLGGAAARLFMVIDGVFTLLHTIDNHAGSQAALIMLSPNQPVRYEIRGVSAGGTMTSVCSQVASEGGASEEGEELSVFSASIACNTVGTIYALKGIRKSATFRNYSVELQSVAASVVAAAVADSGILQVILDPTLSAPLTWAAKSRIEEGTATTQTITAGTGRVLASIPMNSSGNAATTVGAGLKALTIDLDNVAGQVILAYQPTTATQNLVGSMTLVEY